MNYSNIREKDGIVLVDKPSGVTSHDIVYFIRKRFRIKKVGHAGTLDPMATGLLIILLGKFTKKSVLFSGYDKEYEGRLRLGISTDTGDAEGSATSERPIGLRYEPAGEIEKVFFSFHGRIHQIPPMYSAKKIKGKKLYEFARKGIVLEREPVEVEIKDIKVLGVSLPEVTFFVKCSKGTYIRQLAHDIGEKMGCGAHLLSLKRTKIGPFALREAMPFCRLTEVEKTSEMGIIDENILRPE